MAKIIRRTKRKLRLEAIAAFIFVFAFITSIVSNLYVGSLKASLMIDIQNMNLKAENLKVENQKINIEIQTLQNKDRVYTIAQDAGLQQNQDNVVSINNGE